MVALGVDRVSAITLIRFVFREQGDSSLSP